MAKQFTDLNLSWDNMATKRQTPKNDQYAGKNIGERNKLRHGGQSEKSQCNPGKREVKKCLVKVLFYVNMNKQSQCGQTAREQANSGRATRKGIAWPAANKLDSVFLHCLLTATACFHLFFGLLHFLLPASFPSVSRLSVVMFYGQVLAEIGRAHV